VEFRSHLEDQLLLTQGHAGLHAKIRNADYTRSYILDIMWRGKIYADPGQEHSDRMACTHECQSLVTIPGIG
jgi:hypothetical protein